MIADSELTCNLAPLQLMYDQRPDQELQKKMIQRKPCTTIVEVVPQARANRTRRPAPLPRPSCTLASRSPAVPALSSSAFRPLL